MRGRPHPPLPELGLERVTWVRILVEPGGPRCVVAGVACRRPVLRPVPLRTATRLLAAGVPGVVRRAGSPGREAAPGSRRRAVEKA